MAVLSVPARQRRQAPGSCSNRVVARKLLPPFACISGSEPDSSSPDDAPAKKDMPQAPEVDAAQQYGVHPSLFSAPTVMIPEWMSDTYAWWRDSIAFVRRLGLPENSYKDKLPYYKEARSHPDEFTYLSDDLRSVVTMQRLYRKVPEGQQPRMRPRGPRFDMPRVGMKAIVAANITLAIVLSNVTI